MTRLQYSSMTGAKKPRAPRTADETEDYLVKKWGYNEYDEKFEKIQELLKQFASPDLIDYLEHSGLGDYAPMLEKFYEVVEKREQVLKSAGDNLNDSMTNATIKSLNLQTREDLNRAFSDAQNSYVQEYGDDLNTAIPSGDLFTAY